MRCKYFGFIVTIFLAIISCKKDKVDPTPEIKAYSISAGQSGSGFSEISVSNPSAFNISYDSLNLYGVGYDSIDIDQNGFFDLFFELHVINQDSLHLLNGTPNPYPNLSVNSDTNQIEAMTMIELVPIGLGQTMEYTYLDTLSFGTQISSNNDWFSLIDYGLTMWIDSPASTWSPLEGPWDEFSGYMGIRYNGKYGWVKIDCTIPTNPLILGFAIEN